MKVVHGAINSIDVGLSQLVKGVTSYVGRRINGGFRPRDWFQIDPKVQMLWVPSLNRRYIPEADAVIATAWQTAERVVEYPPSKGKPFYLIQSWETWDGPEERVRATWKAPLTKVVISQWLREMAKQLGVECSYIPNGLDFDKFGLDTPTQKRNPKQVMMLYHSYPVKGSADGLQALRIVRERVPDLRVSLFGTPTPNGEVPDWMDYHRLPRQDELRACYNRAAIFVSPSRTEGWPLPPAEAMLCGVALVATDIGGHREYAVHEQNSLLSPAGDPGKIAENVMRLIQDSDLRNRLAIAGHACAKQFSWGRAVNSFEELLKGHHQLQHNVVGCRASLAAAGL